MVICRRAVNLLRALDTRVPCVLDVSRQTEGFVGKIPEVMQVDLLRQIVTVSIAAYHEALLELVCILFFHFIEVEYLPSGIMAFDELREQGSMLLCRSLRLLSEQQLRLL